MSLRLLGRAAALCAAIPCAAWAEVCDKARPDWDGVPVTALTETLHLLTTAPSMVLLIATAFAIRFRHQWGALLVVLGWTIWVSITAFPTSDIQDLAILEGCVGPSWLFIAIVGSMSLGLIAYTAPRRPD